jgi:S1-C subfamily serine protease
MKKITVIILINLISLLGFSSPIFSSKQDSINIINKTLKSIVYIEVYESYSDQISLGTGVIVSKDGYIITNNHILTSDDITITLNDNKKYKATVIKTDKNLDIAILKINVTNLSSVVFDNSDSTYINEGCLAIGGPLGKHKVTTCGIIKSKNSLINFINNHKVEKLPVSFIETTTVINFGSSGGALINKEGRLIGITSAFITSNSFSIPSNLVKQIVESVLK